MSLPPDPPDASSPEEHLLAYAAEWRGRIVQAPEDLDRVFIPELPADLVWSPEAAATWWEDEMAEARGTWMGDAWEAMLRETIEVPVVIGISGGDGFDIWDGNHRLAAAAINGRDTFRRWSASTGDWKPTRFRHASGTRSRRGAARTRPERAPGSSRPVRPRQCLRERGGATSRGG